MIELDRVTRVYGKMTAVADLTLQVAPGEIFAFLGPNGAGKTTTIKMMVGLLHPSAGWVRICGHDVVAQPREASLRTGYVPDQPYLYEKLSGRELLQFVAGLRGMSAADAAAGIAQRIAEFELAAFVDRLTESYSHGMKQRLAFAAALVHRPDVLILDEPLVGLDPRSARLVKDLLRREAAEGAAVFMSTHTLSIAEELADRIGILDGGRLLFLGTQDELQRRFADDQATLERLYLQLTSQKDEITPEASPPTNHTHADC